MWYLYIGLEEDNTGYKWIIDQSPVVYTNWNTVLGHRPDEKCGMVTAYKSASFNYGEIGTWHDAGCSDLFGAICEANKVWSLSFITLCFLKCFNKTGFIVARKAFKINNLDRQAARLMGQMFINFIADKKKKKQSL